MVDDIYTEEVVSIRSCIESWLDKNKNKFELDLTDKVIIFHRHYGSLFTSNDPHVAITLGFEDENLTKYCSVEELRSSFFLIALDRLTITGLDDVPSQWEINPRTSISSFSEGVNLEEYDSSTQILELSIQARFFAIYGKLAQKIWITNQPPPKDTYFQVRRDIKGDIRLRAKLIFK